MSKLFIAAAALVLAAPAVAQDASLRANSGEIGLSSGFTPDPYVVNVVAGGSISANPLPGSCTGSISSAPDFQLTYSSGSLPLAFQAIASADITLVINAPDGSWHCDDDSLGNGDAQVVFQKPSSGVYDVWVGTYSGGTQSAQLRITERP